MPGRSATRVADLGDALRAFVHAEVAADAVAGAVVVVEPGLPEGARGRAASSWGPVVPFGKRARRQRDVALEHAGEAVALLGGRRADGDGAGDVGGAVQVLARRSRPGRACPARSGGRCPSVDAVVDDGAVRAGAGDGRRSSGRGQRAVLGAEGVEPRRRRAISVSPPAGASRASQARKRGTARRRRARGRRARRRAPTSFLHALGGGRDPRARDHLGAAGGGQALGRSRPPCARVGLDASARRPSASSAAPSASGGATRDAVAEVRAEARRELDRIDEEIDRGVARGAMAKASGSGVCGDVARRGR